MSASARVKGDWFFRIDQSPILADVFAAAFQPGFSIWHFGRNRNAGPFQLPEKFRSYSRRKQVGKGNVSIVNSIIDGIRMERLRDRTKGIMVVWKLDKLHSGCFSETTRLSTIME